MIKSDGGSTPGYYGLPEGATDVQDVIEMKQMSWAQGNIFKAAYRLGNKDGTSVEYDLRKIIYYAQRELERREHAHNKHKPGQVHEVNTKTLQQMIDNQHV